MDAGKQSKVFIPRVNLEKSLSYLACPYDKKELKLNINNSEQISEGEFQCTFCTARFPIRNGVPYFHETGNGHEWNLNTTKEDIIKSIAKTIDNKSETMKKVGSLGSLLFSRLKDRKKTIDAIFNTMAIIASRINADQESQALLLQAATAARYDVEVYRGTFTLPEEIIKNIQKNHSQETRFSIVEGACATGECLLEIADKLKSPLYIGLDISGSLVREAQQKLQGKTNILFIQGDVATLPIKENAASIYTINNVLDRVVNPLASCTEANRILGTEKSQLVISNCHPLQFTYTTYDGNTITFVPEERQLSIEDAMAKSNFIIKTKTSGKEETGWKIHTEAYGNENLPFLSVSGIRKPE